jgi:pimeloyl-ACP methyl ester carboxylesterase
MIVVGACAAGARYRPATFAVKVGGHGRPVILIPGLGCDGTIWDATVAHLASRYETHVVSIAGFAGAPPAQVRGPLLDQVRRELVTYIQRNGLRRPIVIGHSLGGFLAYWLAATAPDDLGPVVVVDALPFLGAEDDPAATVASISEHAGQLRDALVKMPPDEFASETRRALAWMITSPDDVARVGDMSVRSEPLTVASAVYEMMTTDLRPLVGQTQVPMLILIAGGTGTQDKVVHAQIDGIPRHTLVVAPTSKHFIMLDAPELFYRSVDDFLDSN